MAITIMRTYMLYHNFKLKLFVDMCKHDSGLTNYKKTEKQVHHKGNRKTPDKQVQHKGNTYW